MKKRTFFVMLILFLVFLNSMILVVSTVILNDKLSTANDKCLAEHYVIASSLIGDIQALEQRGNNVEENIDKLMSSYSRYLQGKGDGLAVAFSGEWIYESSELMQAGNMAAPPDTGFGQERIVYMDNDMSPILCVYGSFPAPWQDYGLMYVGNLSDTLSSWRHTKNILFLMGAVMMLVMAFFLFQFLNIIFRPLRQISSASTKIANGDYKSRLSFQGNLIDNAMKVSQPEGEVCVSVYAKELGIVVEVEDHGIGMEPEQIAHIKEAFYRVDKARSRAAGGTGLGLSICEMIVQLHHAELTFVSEKGKGTKVKLYFPQAVKGKSFTSS